jgi:molybdopterin/thiamine biosynthesis adenylyltransferase
VSRITVTLLEEQRRALRGLLFKDSFEHAAILLLGRASHIDAWSGTQQQRFFVAEVIEAPSDAFLERTPTRLTWSTTPFFKHLKIALARGLTIGVIHSHPFGPLDFSSEDDVADQELVQIIENRLDGENWLVSMVMDDSSEITARAYSSEEKTRAGGYVVHDAQMLCVLGERWTFRYPGRGSGVLGDELDRQVRAFGRASTEDLRQLRIGIVGCGGTGSAVALLLARIGVRYLALIDADTVHGTNLNRMHFSTRADANLQRRKVDVVGESIANLGMDTTILRYAATVDDPACREVLVSCDLVFGCTDDHLGRNLLNKLAHFYYIPTIDMGLSIEPDVSGHGYSAFDGRVTVVQPGYPCQICRKLIDPELMLAESQRRTDPSTYRERVRAGYIVGLAEPNPVVVTFTTELAAMAVNELFQRLNGYRGEDGSCAERVRRLHEVKDADIVPSGRSQSNCPVCGHRKYDGRGDVTPFLDQT